MGRASKQRRGGGHVLADMSLPAEQRKRKSRKTRKTRKPASKQMNHGSGAKAERWRREGEKRMRRSRQHGTVLP